MRFIITYFVIESEPSWIQSKAHMRWIYKFDCSDLLNKNNRKKFFGVYGIILSGLGMKTLCDTANTFFEFEK